MPTLIRLFITLLFLAGLVYAGMIALVSFVQPTPKEVTVRIPQRDLLGGGTPALPGANPAAPSQTAAPGTSGANPPAPAASGSDDAPVTDPTPGAE